MRNTKILGGLIFLFVILLSGIALALTTVNDNGVTVTTGNVTADWFLGKVNISSIQNFQYNYNQTQASQPMTNIFNQDLNTTSYSMFHNMTLGDRGSGNIDGAGYLSIYNNGSTNNSFQISLKSQNTNYNSQYIWYNSSDFALGIDDWGFDGTETGGILIDSWGLSDYGLLTRTAAESNATPLYIDNKGGGFDIVSRNMTLRNGLLIVGDGAMTSTFYLQSGGGTKWMRLASSGSSNVLSSSTNPIEIKSSNGNVYLDQASVDNTLRIRDLNAKEAVINSSNTNVLFGANVTALYFKGDGSQLTNLPATGGNPFNQNLNTTSESALGSLNVSLTTSSGNRGPAVNIVSRNQNQSAVWITGNESDKGTLKIAHTGYVGDDVSSAISIDLQGTGTSAQGIYITSTGGTNGSLIAVNDGTNSIMDLYSNIIRFYRNVQITNTSGNAFLVEKGDGTDMFKIDTSSDLVYTGTLRPRTNLTQDIGQSSILYRGAYFDQNVTARYFKGDGSLLTNLPASTGGYNVTYDVTSQDVTANRSIWGTNHSSVLISQFGTFWYNLTSPAITYANTKAATGNCAAGFVVQNTTTSGVQCVPASTSTTNDGITINGANITAGTIALARLPTLTDTHTLNIANITSFLYNYNQTSLANTYTDGRGFITSTNVAYTNISNNFARSQNVSGNITLRTGDNACLDGDACTKKIFYNGSNLILQG